MSDTLESTPLSLGVFDTLEAAARAHDRMEVWRSHSSTCWLNVSAFCGIGGAFSLHSSTCGLNVSDFCGIGRACRGC